MRGSWMTVFTPFSISWRSPDELGRLPRVGRFGPSLVSNSDWLATADITKLVIPCYRPAPINRHGPAGSNGWPDLVRIHLDDITLDLESFLVIKLNELMSVRATRSNFLVDPQFWRPTRSVVDNPALTRSDGPLRMSEGKNSSDS